MTTIALSGRVDRQAIAQELEEARARTLLLVAPLTDEDLRLAARPADEPASSGTWGTSRISRSCGSPATSTGRSSSSRCRASTTRSSIRAATAARWRCRDSRTVARSWTRSAERVLARLIAADLDAAAPAAPRRLRVPDGAPARVPAQRDHAADAAAQAGRAVYARAARLEPCRRSRQLIAAGRDGAFPRRARSRSAPTTARRLRQRARAAHGVD